MSFTDSILDIVGNSFPLKEKATGEFAKQKVGPMKFDIYQYEAEGLGNVSLMHGTAMMGLMKMDTVIINPFDKDMALFSYDRIYAMGNDTLFLEIYDTRMEKISIGDTLKNIVSEYADIPEEPVNPNWYDDIKFPESIKKKGKKKITKRFDEFSKKYVQEYINICKSLPECNREDKIKAAKIYTEGLLSNGGPSTDQFIKEKGKEFTEKLFRDVLFATGD